MHQFKVGDSVTWVRASGAREDASVIDVGESAVRIQVLAPYSTYWVSPGDLEPRLPPGAARYTSPTLTRQQVQALMAQLEVADRQRLSVCLRITEHPGGPTIVELVPASEVVG